MSTVLKRLFALLKGMLSVALDLPPVAAAREWWRGLDWQRRRTWHRWWAKAWRPGAWLAGLVVAGLLLHAVGLWGWIGDLIALTGDAFRSVQASGFGAMDAPEQVEALRNLLWGLSVVAGTVGALVAMGFAAWRTWNDARRADTERRKLETETFATAMEQLGNPDFAIRLGAILNLETLAKSSPRLHPVIMEAFCAYLREKRPMPAPLLEEADAKAPWQEQVQKIRKAVAALPPFPKDLQAIVTALGRRTVAYDRLGSRLDLRGADLRKADLFGGNFEGSDLTNTLLEGAILSEAHLENADLSGANLEGADLWGAHLEGADLWGAHLEGADVWQAHLEGAGLRRAHLEGAKLWGAHLEGASLRRAHLEGASLRRAHLEGASLRRAHLEGARLYRAHLEGADLEDAHLEGADLRDTDITQAQLDSAHGNAHTRIPDHLTRPAHWTSAPAADPPDPN